MQLLNYLNLWGFCAPPSCTYDVHWRTLKIQHLQMWYYSKWSQNVRMLSPLKRRHPAYVTLLVKSPFCPQCCKNLPHIVHHIYFWTTTCKHIIALPVFIGKPTSFRNGFNHTLILIKNTSMPTYYSQFQSLYGRLHTDPKWWFLPTYFAYGQPN